MKKIFSLFLITILLNSPVFSEELTYINFDNKIAQEQSQTTVKKKSTNSNSPENWSLSQAKSAVERIGNKLLVDNNITTNVKFSVRNIKDVNAYADGNNNIVVYYGILPYCETEDELAFILGHELGHIYDQHVKKGSIARVATVCVGEIIAVVTSAITRNPSAYNAVSNGMSIAGNLGNKKYSRTQERDADFHSVDFITKSGYNPYVGMQILGKIGSSYVDFFKDHPSPEKRLAKMTKYIKEKYPQFIQ